MCDCRYRSAEQLIRRFQSWIRQGNNLHLYFFSGCCSNGSILGSWIV